TVVVDVTERTPVAQAPAAGGGWAEVDATGRVLGHSATSWPGLVSLSGIPPLGSPGQALTGYGPALTVAAALPSSVLAHVSGVAQVPGGAVRLSLRPQGLVELGGTTQLQAKLTSLASVLSQVDLAKVKTIDLRVPETPTLTRG
ncbi:MAG: cell division protein FtsQ/DivIB, partial [Acidimicrobiales bacterium]